MLPKCTNDSGPSIESSNPWCKLCIGWVSRINRIVIWPVTRIELFREFPIWIDAKRQPILTTVHSSLSLSRICQWCLHVSALRKKEWNNMIILKMVLTWQNTGGRNTWYHQGQHPNKNGYDQKHDKLMDSPQSQSLILCGPRVNPNQ